MRYPLVLCIVVSNLCLIYSGCTDLDQTATPEQPRDQEIPDDVTYPIIDSNILPGIKRSLDVRLSRKVSEQALRAIALELKSQDSRRYERTFIVYYLPDMTVGAGGWATTHFTPDLKVSILGSTLEQEQAFLNEATPSDRKIIGRWVNDSIVGTRITIFRQEGDLYIEHVYKDGSSGKEALVETSSTLGRRFDMVEGSSSGDHWILDSQGDLQIRDNEGLISTARKVE